MSDNKERVYSEEDLCEYTILQKIDALEKQLEAVKNEASTLYETKEAADAIHRKLRQNDAQINNKVDALNKVTPTDVGVKDNKLGLLHDTTWLTNQDAINLDGFTYDEATKTLKAGEGSQLDYLYFNLAYNDEDDTSSFTYTLEQYNEMIVRKPIIFNDRGLYYNTTADKNNDTNNYEITITKTANMGPELGYANATIALHGVLSSTTLKTNLSLTKGEVINYQVNTNSTTNISYLYILYNNLLTNEQATGTLMPDYTNANNNQVMAIVNGYPEWTDVNFKSISLFGKHSILVPKDSADSNIDLYRHDLELTNDNDEELYLTYYSSSNLLVDSFTDLNTLLTNKARYIMVNGFIKEADKLYQIVHINWNGTYANSNYDYTLVDNDGVLTTDDLSRFTMVTDTVTTI